ncbi:hypothetical protein UPYG_G00104610 [Umbra pygmaea]|uniref:Ig-like domain-containing protein n=1 Tax=Umbra pygmaea TaxID=75934 RepID=A0ABD0X5C4_UMBPY
MFPASLLLLLAVISCVHCGLELTQPGILNIKPGESLVIDCKVSGYSLTDSSNVYGVAWARPSMPPPFEGLHQSHHHVPSSDGVGQVETCLVGISPQKPPVSWMGARGTSSWEVKVVAARMVALYEVAVGRSLPAAS